MSYTLFPNFSDTGTQDKSLPRANLSWSTDFRHKTGKDSSSAAFLENITSPKDAPEVIKCGYEDISNIYANSGIDPKVYAPSVKGGRVLVQVNDTYSYYDPNDLSAPRYDLPVSAQIVLKFPNFEEIDETVLLTTIGRAIGAMFDTDDNTTARLKAICRGCLVPLGL